MCFCCLRGAKERPFDVAAARVCEEERSGPGIRFVREVWGVGEGGRGES